MPRKTDKRERLLHSAMQLMHQQGVGLTTLSDIAEESGVPLGNVYYYFKTKEAIGSAVIDQLWTTWQERLHIWDMIPDPTTRLRTYVQYYLDNLDVLGRFGCQVGGLCQELAKKGGTLGDASARLMHQQIEWVERQFTEIVGSPDAARPLAIEFIARIQGMALLSNTFKDPAYAGAIANHLFAWLSDLFMTMQHRHTSAA